MESASEGSDGGREREREREKKRWMQLLIKELVNMF